MFKTDTSGGRKHIQRMEPYTYADTSIGPVPLYKTLCGIEATISMPEEENPTCKKCIKLRSE